MTSHPIDGPLAAYYRTSSDQQEQDETIEAQRLYVRRWCARQELPLAAEFSDDGVSGLTELVDRAGFTSLLRAAERQEFKTLVVFAVDRLGREAYFVLHAFHELRKRGVPILSATQSYDPYEATGRLLISFLAGQAETDKITIHNRTEAGKEQLLAKDDLYLGGVVPYGYCLQWRGEKQVYALCDAPIPGREEWTPRLVIEHIFRRYDAGDSAEAIAAELAALRLPTCWVPGDRRYGAPSYATWTAQRICRTLSTTMYRGEQTVRRREGPVTRAVPALVSPELWERCRQMRLRNRTMGDSNTARDYLLRGKIRCAHCGQSYCGAAPVPGSALGRHYRCNWRSRRPLCPCPGKWVPAEPLEEAVKEHLAWILTHVEEFMAQVVDDQGRAGAWAEARLAEADRLEKQRAVVEKRTLEYYRQRAAELIKSDAVLRQLLDETEAEAARLLQKAQEARQEALQALEQEAAVDEAAAVLERVRGALAGEPSAADWQRLVEVLVDRVVVETVGTGRDYRTQAAVHWRVGASVKHTTYGSLFNRIWRAA